MGELLKDRVAVVTGSGRGLGRAYARAMAKQGAKLVINDLGCANNGVGTSPIPADQVTKEIIEEGGTAVANYDSVATPEGAQRIIKTAVDSYGRVDILVNNAGIFRENLIFNMTNEDFDWLIKTHLYGTFYCTREASQIMIKQKYGRIVNISSIAGFGSMAGFTNYSAAKEGIAAFTRTVSRDLVKYGITCNAIRPAADTRLGSDFQEGIANLEKIIGQSMTDNQMNMPGGPPEDVAPLVVYLVSEQAKNISNCIFQVYGKYIAIFDDPPQKAQSLTRDEGRFTPEELAVILPKTLTKNVRLPTPVETDPSFSAKFKEGAKGWLWAKGNLTEVPPT
jgi:NAD(P)-dependent dehydrogenase (short-subunit alcohol dehydrogenase family)